MDGSFGFFRMLRPAELRVLDEWCRERGLRWAAAASVEPALMLEQTAPTRAWQRMMLRLDHDALRLHDEAGALLAEASTLPALLDAVDGGVAEPQPAPFSRVRELCAGLAAHIVL